MIRDGLRNNWVRGGLIVVLGLSLLTEDTKHQVGADLRSVTAPDGSRQWPLAIDVAPLVDEEARGTFISYITNLGSRAVDKVQGNSAGNSPGQTSAQPAQPEAIQKAALTLQTNKTSLHCPTEKQYTVSFADPEGGKDVVACLRSDTLEVQKGAEGSVVVFEYETSRPDRPIDVRTATPDQCTALTTPLKAYGGSLLRATQMLPAGTSAPVEVRYSQDTATKCDTWPQASVQRGSTTN